MASILFRPQCVDELILSSLNHIKIQILILILPYVHKYVICVLWVEQCDGLSMDGLSMDGRVSPREIWLDAGLR